MEREIGHKGRIAEALNAFAVQVWWQGDFGRAQTLLEESTAFAREAGNTWMVGWSLSSRGLVEVSLGDPQAAYALQVESLRTLRAIDNNEGAIYAPERFAHIAAAAGHWK